MSDKKEEKRRAHLIERIHELYRNLDRDQRDQVLFHTTLIHQLSPECREAELLYDVIAKMELLDQIEYVSQINPSPAVIVLMMDVAKYRARIGQATIAAGTRHSKRNGSREKAESIRNIWASGKYSSRDICAEQECAALGMSFSTARKSLRGMPDPS
jgi:hypothetical protein